MLGGNLHGVELEITPAYLAMGQGSLSRRPISTAGLPAQRSLAWQQGILSSVSQAACLSIVQVPAYMHSHASGSACSITAAIPEAQPAAADVPLIIWAVGGVIGVPTSIYLTVRSALADAHHVPFQDPFRYTLASGIWVRPMLADVSSGAKKSHSVAIAHTLLRPAVIGWLQRLLQHLLCVCIHPHS